MANSSLALWVDTARCPATIAACPIGIVSSVLSIISLWRKVVSEKNVFYISMTTVAILDLFFNCTFIYVKCGQPTYPKAISTGFVYSASLASDLCALALTAERYTVLCWPQITQNLSGKTAKSVRAAVALVICIVSLIRLQYMVDELDEVEPFSEGFKDWWQPIETALLIFSDLVLPVLLVVSMVFFSAKIVIVVVKRRRKRVKVHPDPHGMSIRLCHVRTMTSYPDLWAAKQRHTNVVGLISPTDPEFASSIYQTQMAKKSDDASSTISLVMILDVFFILNQIGYCFCTVSDVWKQSCGECPFGIDLTLMAEFVSDFLECVSRSLHFYFYVRFSQSLRREFLDVARGVRARLCKRH